MDTYIAPSRSAQVAPTRVNGFIVVSIVCGGFVYQHHARLAEAHADFKAIRRGEHPGFTHVAIVPAINGIPYGGALDVNTMDIVRPGVENSPENRAYWERSKFNHPECHSGVVYRQGEQARAMGMHQTDNPYIESSVERGEWAKGWHGTPSDYIAAGMANINRSV